MFREIIKYPLKSNRKQKAIGFFVALAISFSGIIFIQSFHSVQAKDDNLKIITVFENGKRTSFKTKEDTVGKALRSQNIFIAKEDNVEPNLNEKLTDTDYNINIYRANPFIVSDGFQKIKVMTAAKTSKKIVEAAGLEIFDEDIIYDDTSKSTIEDGAIAILNIKRAKILNLKIFGKTEQVRTQAETVEQFLKEKKISLGENDQVSVDIKSKINNGSYFEIWRNGKQTITVEESVKFETEKIQDASKDSGFSEVRTKGEDGKKTVTYEVEMRNGVEVSRKKISEIEIKASKKQVEVVGTKLQIIVPTDHVSLMTQAGIPANDFSYAEWLISKESGWRVNASNPSGAYGLPQALPGSKMASAGADWRTNPVTQLKWMNGYVMGRYGSWANAKAHSQAKGWY